MWHQSAIFETVDRHFVKSEIFSLTWSCGSRQRDTTSSGWKFRLNNLVVEGLMLWLETAQTAVSQDILFYSIWIFTHLKLCLADAFQKFKWLKIIQIWQNRRELFSNLADIDVTLYG